MVYTPLCGWVKCPDFDLNETDDKLRRSKSEIWSMQVIRRATTAGVHTAVKLAVIAENGV